MSCNYIILEPVLRPVVAGWTIDTNEQGNIYIFGSTHRRARYPGIIYSPRCLAVWRGGYPKNHHTSIKPHRAVLSIIMGHKNKYPIKVSGQHRGKYRWPKL